MRNKKIVVTGGAGFIGSNLVETLCTGNDVIVIDDLSTGDYANIKAVVESRGIVLEKCTVNDLGAMQNAFAGVDFVFHQAAIPSVMRSVKDPVSVNEAGIDGTLKVLVAARDCGVRKIVLASSSSVYGDTPVLPKQEAMPPNPLSPYAVTKLTCEHYARVFHELYGLKTVALRYFNVYGPHQDPKSDYAAVVPRFIIKNLAGERLLINGDGNQTRDFTFVRDVVNANVLAAESGATGVYNIASGRRISINDLADTIFALTGKNTGVEHLPPRPGDVRHSLADISQAHSDFGYIPNHALERGLAETLEWFRQNPAAGQPTS